MIFCILHVLIFLQGKCKHRCICAKSVYRNLVSQVLSDSWFQSYNFHFGWQVDPFCSRWQGGFCLYCHIGHATVAVIQWNVAMAEKQFPPVRIGLQLTCFQLHWCCESAGVYCITLFLFKQRSKMYLLCSAMPLTSPQLCSHYQRPLW